MQIKVLLAILPFFLEHVSSLPLPPATDTCVAVESFARRSGDLHDVPQHLLRRCALSRDIEGHLESLSNIHQRELPESQHYTLVTRMVRGGGRGGGPPRGGAPPKRGSSRKAATKKTTAKTEADEADDLVARMGAAKIDDANPADEVASGMGPARLSESSTEPAKKPSQEPSQEPTEGGSAPAGPSNKGKEKEEPPPDRGDDGDNIPLSKERKNYYSDGDELAMDKDHTMYNIITPNPRESEGIKSIRTGEQSYYRKIGDGDVNLSGRYNTHNPHYSAAKSHGQEESIPVGDTVKRPGEFEELVTTGHSNKKGLTEWHKITPKTQKELDEAHAKLLEDKAASSKPVEEKPAPVDSQPTEGRPRRGVKKPVPVETKPAPTENQGVGGSQSAGSKPEDGNGPSPVEGPPTAWTNEDLRQNLIKQQNNFKNHKSGETNDEYGQLTQEMLRMCNHEQCRKGEAPTVARRAISEQPHLRKRLESLLKERDELIAMAMR